MRLCGLVQRGTKFYFQCRIPSDVKQYFPCTQLKKSLKTTNQRQASTLVKIMTANTEKLFFMVRSGLLTAKMIESLVQEYLAVTLDIDKRQRYGITENVLDDAFLRIKQDNRDRYWMDHRKNYEMYSEVSGEVEEVVGADNLASHYRVLATRYREQGRRQDYAEIAPVASALLTIEKVQVSPGSPEFMMFCDALLAKEAEAFEVLAERAERGLNNPYDNGVGAVMPCRKKLSMLMTRYLTVHQEQWEPRSRDKTDEHYDKILELTGDPYTDEINQDMLVELFNELALYPKYRNHPHLKGLTLEACREHPAYEPPKTSTIKGVWYALGSLLTYGSENGEYGIPRNYCLDKVFAVKIKALKKAKNDTLRRLPCDHNDIQSLINELGRLRKKYNPHMLWIPLIALYNGMRQGEICQLFCDDIVSVDGIDCFRIRDCADRKQSVKNAQSLRTIPIHPTLLDLGLLDFINSRRTLKYERPWQNVKSRPVDYYEKQDTYAHYFEKWFNDTFRKYVILDEEMRKQKPFHSLRHTFINWYFQNVRSQERDNAAVKGLVGHLESDEQKMITAMLKGISWEVYSQELNPVPLMESLRLLNYDIDLSPLGLPIKW
jgi:integrase